MRLNESPTIDNPHLRQLLSEAARQVNGVSSGVFAVLEGTRDTAPSVAGADGDFVKKKTRAVAGSPGSRYVVDGWECIGGVWVERRFLTGT